MSSKKMISKKQVKKQNDKNKLVNSKINYKIKYEKSFQKIKNLEINLIEQKRENQINIDDFQKKAKKFQSKAQMKVDKFKKILFASFEKEKEVIKKYGSQEILKSSLEIILNIEIAIKTGEKNKNILPYVQGFKMLINQFYENLKNYGVKKIIPKINQKFNPKIHYAIEAKKEKKDLKNKIIKIIKEGFMLYDRVIKPAIVIIGK